MDARERQLADCRDPEVFDDLLRTAGLDYQLLSRDPGGRCARLRFTGPFRGRRVIWDCTLSTLASLGLQKNFIEVGEPGGAVMAIDIGLDIASIDAAAIRKTIVMVRQYKLLDSGRHEFGRGSEE